MFILKLYFDSIFRVWWGKSTLSCLILRINRTWSLSWGPLCTPFTTWVQFPLFSNSVPQEIWKTLARLGRIIKMSSIIVLWTEYLSANTGIDVFSIKRLKFIVEQDSCIFDLFKLLSILCLEMPWMVVCHTTSKINCSLQTDLLDYRSCE